MAEIIPFRGFLYNVSKISIEEVLAPPYDIITPEWQEFLYQKSPYNIVRIDFGKEESGDHETENRYIRAKRYLTQWIQEGILIQSNQSSFYAYEIIYNVHGNRKRLVGFFGLVKLEELGKGTIYPHECTHSNPKQDRLNLLRVCEANTSPIFSLYKSLDHGIEGILSKITITKPYLQATDLSGNLHRLWQIDRIEDITLIQKELADKAIFIADGHHRYETSFEYWRAMSEMERSSSDMKPYDYTLMFLTNMMDEGITILPTHRLVKEIPEDIEVRLSKYFDMERITNDFDIHEKLLGKKNVFGFFKRGGRGWSILTYRGQDLSGIHSSVKEIDVIILHEMIFKKILPDAEIGYEMDITKAIDRVNQGEYTAAFFLNATGVEDVEKAALSAIRMPPKSTYFYPKLLTGLVLNKWG